MCPVCPITHTSILVLLGTSIISFIFSFLWYCPFFGKTWAALNGMKVAEKKDCKECHPPASSLVLSFLGSFLTVWVMAFILHQRSCACPYGTALLAWVGFQIPILLSPIAWEKKSWGLFALNAVYYFLNLELIAAILSHWRI